MTYLHKKKIHFVTVDPVRADRIPVTPFYSQHCANEAKNSILRSTLERPLHFTVFACCIQMLPNYFNEARETIECVPGELWLKAV